MKSFQTIVLVIFGILAVVGLFLFATFSGIGGGAPVGRVVIWGSLPQAAVEAGIEELVKTDKQFEDVMYTEMAPEALESQLAEAIASGSGPDLVILTQEQILSQGNKMSLIPYTSVSERNYISTYTPIHELFLESEGFYGMPLAVDPIVLYYNRSLLSAAGVATPPTSWEAVTGLAEKLTVRRPDQSIQKSTIAFGEYTNVSNARAVISLLLLQSGTTITERPAQGGMRSTLEDGIAGSGVSPAVSAMNFYTQFANPVKTVYSWNRSLASSRNAFLAGDLAFYVGFASEQPFLSEANPNLDYDMAPIPQPGLGSSPKTYGLAYAAAIPRAAANFEGAFRVAVSLSFAQSMEVIAQKASMAPARRALLTDYPDSYAEVYYPQALISAGWLSPAPRVTDSVFSAMIDNITTGRRDVPAAILSAHQTLSGALR